MIKLNLNERVTTRQVSKYVWRDVTLEGVSCNTDLLFKVTVGYMMMENMVTFLKCCSSQAITDRNLKLGRDVEKASKRWKSELFLSIYEFNSHFQGVKIEKFVKC